LECNITKSSLELLGRWGVTVRWTNLATCPRRWGRGSWWRRRRVTLFFLLAVFFFFGVGVALVFLAKLVFSFEFGFGRFFFGFVILVVGVTVQVGVFIISGFVAVSVFLPRTHYQRVRGYLERLPKKITWINSLFDLVSSVRRNFS
jgi:hypothetical protein